MSPAYFAEATAAYIRAKAAATVQAQSDREVAARLDRIEAKIPAPAAMPPPPDPGLGTRRCLRQHDGKIHGRPRVHGTHS